MASLPSTSKASVRFNDPNFEEIVMKWCRELDSDCSDLEEDAIIESDHETESEIEASDNEYENRTSKNEDQGRKRPRRQDNEEEEQTNKEEANNDNSINEIAEDIEAQTNFFGKNRFRWSSAEPKKRMLG